MRVHQRWPRHIAQIRIWFYDQKPARLQMPLEWSNEQIVKIPALLPELREVRSGIATQLHEVSHAACQFHPTNTKSLKVHSTVVEGPRGKSRLQELKRNNCFV